MYARGARSWAQLTAGAQAISTTIRANKLRLPVCFAFDVRTRLSMSDPELKPSRYARRIVSSATIGRVESSTPTAVSGLSDVVQLIVASPTRGVT